MTAKGKCSRTVEKQGLRAYRGHWSRILAVALCLSLVLGLVPLMPETSAHAGVIDSGTCGDNLTWELDDNDVLTISGTGAMFISTSFCTANLRTTAQVFLKSVTV